jgi:hypothetical protein
MHYTFFRARAHFGPPTGERQQRPAAFDPASVAAVHPRGG